MAQQEGAFCDECLPFGPPTAVRTALTLPEPSKTANFNNPKKIEGDALQSGFSQETSLWLLTMTYDTDT